MVRLVSGCPKDNTYNCVALKADVCNSRPANQPEFMEHLGFMPDFNEASYQSFLVDSAVRRP
jgi:hypothetical protein